MAGINARDYDAWLHAPLRRMELEAEYWEAIETWVTTLDDPSKAPLTEEHYLETFGNPPQEGAPEFADWALDNSIELLEKDFLKEVEFSLPV